MLRAGEGEDATEMRAQMNKRAFAHTLVASTATTAWV